MNNLRALRELAGLRQGAVAKELGLKSQVSLSEWETGRKSLSVENAIMFARYFSVSVGCVVGTEPIPEGFPDCYIQPVFYSEVVENQAKAAEEGRLYKPKKAPFTQAQIEYLDERDNQLVVKITTALREDSFLLRENQKEAE